MYLSLLFVISVLVAPDNFAQQADTVAAVPVNPLSISGLREYARTASARFILEYDREPLEAIKRRVVSFSADGLNQYALILEPTGTPPSEGWPVLLMNHGHHPDPPQYGRIANDVTDRPGDYYRVLPIAFARQGFLVVVPDFRGHNDSQGGEYARGLLESNWYARDSIAAFRALDSLPVASKVNRFMWGHSMGGAITLRVLLALRGEVTGASIWSSMTTDTWKTAIYQSLLANDGVDIPSIKKPAIDKLLIDIDALPFPFNPHQADATRYIQELETPLSIHHSVLDASTAYFWSVGLAAKMYQQNKPYNFYSYAGDRHLFSSEDIALAISRDTQFFSSLMQ